MTSSQSANFSNNMTTLGTLISKAGEKIAAAIQTASAQTGTDFSYLMQQAQVESSFKADAKAGSSSATGLFQFIDSTWLQMVNKYGAKYGLGDLASQISDDGKVVSKDVKKQILALRNDPHICSLMAGELASENKNYLQSCTNCDIGSTELYMAHFLGPAGASKFLNAMDKNPKATAASLFPAAADANKNIFYAANGKPRSLNDVYNLLDKKFQLDSTSCSVASASSDKNTTTPSLATTTRTPENDMAKNTPVPSSRIVAVRSTKPAPTGYDANRNYGGIPGLQSPVILPIDVLALMRTDTHKDNDRYNS